MAEKAVFTARAVVYYFDPKTRGWTPTTVGSNFCRVDMYENSSTVTYRVIGRGLQDTTKVVINSTLAKDTAYTRASETFHQWSDNRYIYGLNFVTKEEAESFGTGFENIVNKLKSGGTMTQPSPPQPPQPPQPPVQQQQTGSLRREIEPDPQPPVQPSHSGGPPPPPAPPGPPKPPSGGPPPPPSRPLSNPPSSGGGGGGDRGGLLSSITGFSANKLKKVETVDKSSPILKTEPASSRGGSVSGGGGGGMMADIMNARKKIVTNTNTPMKKEVAPPPTPMKQVMPMPMKKAALEPPVKLQNSGSANRMPASTISASRSESPAPSSIKSEELLLLKEEILSEMRAELQRVKEEILAALGNR